MKRLVYASRSKPYWFEEELDELVGKASQNNRLHNISGFLFYHEGRFLQYIEGEEQEIDKLYAKILADARHTIVHCSVRENEEAQLFPEWNMVKIRRKDLISFGMEQMLLDFMLIFDGSVYPKIERHDIKIWEMIAKISALRAEFSF